MACPSFGALTSQAHSPTGVARIVMNAVVVAAFAITAAFSPVLGMPITEFEVPTAFSSPLSITAGPDGNLWFTEWAGNKIGRMTTSGAVTEFTLPLSPEIAPGVTSNRPSGITAGPDGNLWFTEWAGNRIGRMTLSGMLTEFLLPAVRSFPTFITAGSDGNLWFTESGCGPTCGGNAIGRMTTSGVLTEFALNDADHSGPDGITEGPDGNLWFTGYPSRIGRISPSGGLAQFGGPTGVGLYAITTGSDGNLWFTEETQVDSTAEFHGAIGRISPGGVLTEFPLTIPDSRPAGITAGPDGNLWFADTNAKAIGRISADGIVTEFPLPTNGTLAGGVGPDGSGPSGITVGPDGNLWFADTGTNTIGRMNLFSQPTDRDGCSLAQGQYAKRWSVLILVPFAGLLWRRRYASRIRGRSSAGL
jgi:streptogramin lyase